MTPEKHNLIRVFLLATLSLCLGCSAVLAQGDDEELVPLFLANETPASLLNLLEQLTGEVILRPQNLPNAEISFESGEYVNREFTRDEAVAMVESLLAMHGVTLVNIDEETMRAVPVPIVNALTPTIITDTASAGEDTQRVFSMLFQFEHVRIEQGLEVIQGLITNGMPAPLSLNRSNGLMVTDALANLRRIEDVLSRLDRPRPFDREIRFIALNNIGAEDMKNRLDAFIESSLEDYISGDLGIQADERTNQLVVIGHASNMAIIEQVVAQLDKDIEPMTRTRVFRIKHAEAVQLSALLQQVITGQQQVRDQQERSRGATNRTPQRTNQAQAGAGSNSSTAQGLAQALSDGAANAQFSEFVGLVSDERSNSIVAYGTRSDLLYLEELLEQVDVLLDQVRIEVIIAEVTLRDDQARGIETFGLNIEDVNGITSAALSITGASGSRLGQTFGVDAEIDDAGGSWGTLEDFSLGVVFDAAKRNDRVQVLSAPTIVTTHNKPATINVSEARPIITSTQTDTTGTSTRSSVNFRDIGIQLEVTPLIGTNGVVQLEVKQTVENVTGNVNIDGNQQPIIGRREATSWLGVRDGEIVILGGLQEINESRSKGRVAFFGGIPILGDLFFSSRSREGDVRELIIFIQPTILSSTEAADAAAREYLETSKVREQVDYYRNEGRFEEPPKQRSFLFFEWEEDPEDDEEAEAADSDGASEDRSSHFEALNR